MREIIVGIGLAIGLAACASNPPPAPEMPSAPQPCNPCAGGEENPCGGGEANPCGDWGGEENPCAPE